MPQCAPAWLRHCSYYSSLCESLTTFQSYCLIKVLQFNSILFPTALTPGSVQNLTATLDPNKPCVILKWNPPVNARYPGDVTNYQVRFWDKERSCYNDKNVNGSANTTVITRESGLRPLTETTFKVRACSGDAVSPEWRTVSKFVGT